MSIPDKRTILAAVIYGLSKPIIETRATKASPKAWSALTAQESKPYVDVSEFIGGQLFGLDPQTADRPKLAASLEAQNFEVLKEANANMVVAIVVNVSSALT